MFNFDLAIDAWRQVLGDDWVARDPPVLPDTSGVRRSVPAVLRPASEDEVVQLVQIAARHRAPIYPVSTGRNWGYGGPNPVEDNTVIVDLSRLNSMEIDVELGLATVGPGVTQGQLRAYLDQNNLPFMVPTTGAGPTASLLGNALDRGYGITPVADHFGAVTAVRAVLPDGRIYVSALTEQGGGRVDRAHKWGVGPYVDGLFAQGAFGVVVSATIVLARRPEHVEAFQFEPANPGDLTAVIGAIQDLLRSSGGTFGGINLMNRLRFLAMTAPYPVELRSEAKALTPAMVEVLGMRHGIPPWLGLGAIYGSREVTAAMRRVVRRILGPHCRAIRFFSDERLGKAKRALSLLPAGAFARTRSQIATAGDALALLSGDPRETALALAYWRSGLRPVTGRLDPARDGCGLIWYSPLVPMIGEQVRAYEEMVTRICPQFGIDPLVTLSSLSDRCFDSTVPILFDPITGSNRAHDCYHALFEAGRAQGFLPYRMGVESMSLYTETEGSVFWNLVRVLKASVDPHNILAPGRYAPIEHPGIRGGGPSS